MVFTQNQKKELNRDLLQYLFKSQYKQTAQTFAKQIGEDLSEVDLQENKFEKKWKSILLLQKKIAKLEEEIVDLKKLIGWGPYPQPPIPDPEKLKEIFIPKTPAKFEMKGHKMSITSLAFHPQFTQIASSAEDGTIKLWQFETGDFERTLKGHTNPITCVNYDPQGRYLVSSSSDMMIKLWDLNNDYACIKTLAGHNHNVSFVQFFGDGEMIISCSRDKTIKIWEVATGYCKKTFVGHDQWVRRVAVAKDGNTFVSCSDDQTIIVWNINKQNPITRYPAHDNVIQSIIIIEGQNGGKLMNSQFLKHKFTSESKINALKDLKEQGANGITNYYQSFLLTGSRDKLIKLFILQTGQILHTFHGHDNWVRSLSLHSSGKYFYSGSDDKTIRVWDLNYGKEKKRIDAHQHFISTVRFNHKYGVIASGGNDTVLKIWHLWHLK